MNDYLAVAAGAALGAPARFLVDRAVSRWATARPRSTSVPLGTLTVNATGSLALGLVAGFVLYQGLRGTAPLLLGTGFCGAYTTFSTYAYETVRLAEERLWRAAAGSTAANLVLGTLAAASGLAVASVL